MKVLYTATAKSVGGREGRVASSDGVLDLALAVPEAMGGAGGTKTNPEQLFAAGYAACFHSALEKVARERGVSLGSAWVEAHVGVGPREQGGFGLDIEMHVGIPGMDRADAEALTAKAHEICPYSNATRGNVDVRLVVDPD